ncbi:MAG: M48 family metalloprotease [Minisyncoccia bacterium]
MNNIKTTVLLGLLTGLVLFFGYQMGGEQGLLLGLFISFAMNFGSYWFSDKIVLSMYKAKQTSKEENPKIFQMVEDLAIKVGIPMPKVFIIDLPVPNAFATGRNKNHASMALSKSIITLLTDDELKAVIAHELGHIKHNDILTSSIAAMLAGVISYLSRIAYFTGSRNDENRGGGIIFLVITPIIATLLHLAVSRSREFAADILSAETTNEPETLISALQKISSATAMRPIVPTPQNEATAHMFIFNPFKKSLLSTLFSTHPTLEARIEQLRKMKNK